MINFTYDASSQICNQLKIVCPLTFDGTIITDCTGCTCINPIV